MMIKVYGQEYRAYMERMEGSYPKSNPSVGSGE